MPTPGANESQSDFVSRCIPKVLEEGTASDQAQAVAICNSMYQQAKKGGRAMQKVVDDKDQDQPMERATPQGMMSSDLSGEQEIRDTPIPDHLRQDKTREQELDEILPID